MGSWLVSRPLWLGLSAVALALWCACSAELKQVDTAALEQAFLAPSAVEPDPATAARQNAARDLSQRSVQALKQGDFQAGGLALQSLRQNPSLNVDQLTAVQETLSALQHLLVQQAERGDEKAAAILQSLLAMPGR